MQLRLIEPTGYTVPGGTRTATPDTEAQARDALKALAVQHAAQWDDFGYHPSEYRILTDPAESTETRMKIGPRTGELQNHQQHFWRREINGITFMFVHVKVSRLGTPYMAVSRLDTGELVRCSCVRDDCPFAS